MKFFIRQLPATLLALGLATLHSTAANWMEGMKEGKPEFKSMGQLTFGPEGILFIADAQAASIVAIATSDTMAAAGEKSLKVEGINQKIAGLLGTTADQISINDLAVNPISRQAYLTVSRGRSADAVPMLLRVKGDGQLEAVGLDHVKYSRAELPDAPIDGVVGQGGRQSNPRRESITDIAFFQDRLLIAGLSKEEFSSAFRAIPFPFKAVANGTSVEMYHGSHGQFETKSPIRTFVPFNIGNEPSLLAAYTCTPLVQLPIKDLQPGARVKGKTIAELGMGNRPIDMLVYKKDGKDYLLLANDRRGVMKISTDHIEDMENITAHVAGTKGLPYETIDTWKGVDHLASLDPSHALVLRRDGGSLNLESMALP